MNCFVKSTWQPKSRNETKITFSKNYYELHRVAKIDHLIDTIYKLKLELLLVMNENYGDKK